MRLQQPQLPAAPNDKFLGDLVFKVKSILTGIVNAVNGKAASGANSDITSLTGLTTALTVAQGGTGAASPSAARGNLGAAASGSNADITALTALASVNGGPLAGLRNAIINGAFGINQRGVSGTVTLTAGAYGHDRWKAGAAGCTYTFATSGNHTVLTITAGSLMQVIEDANVDTGTYALSHQGTAQARIGINGAATSGAYAAASTASPLTASPTGGQNVTVEFSTGTVDRAQFEPGTVATPFERRPYGLELALCQRYYEVINGGSFTLDATPSGPQLLNARGWARSFPYKVAKRSTPTCSFTYSATGMIPAPGLIAESSAAVIGKGGDFGVSTETGNNPFLYNITITASAEL